MRIINPFKTYNNYKRWRNIVKFNHKQLKSKGFLINWVYQLGIIISLTENDIDDLKFIYDPFQFEVAKEKFMLNRMAETLQKHNPFFLDQGLLELLDDDYRIEDSDTVQFTQYVTLSFRQAYFNNFMTWLILSGFISGVSLLIYKLFII